jgi:hypothetical protein
MNWVNVDRTKRAGVEVLPRSRARSTFRTTSASSPKRRGEQAVHHLVHRSVATQRHHHVQPDPHGLPSKLGGVTPAPRLAEPDVHLVPQRRMGGLYTGRRPGIAQGPPPTPPGRVTLMSSPGPTPVTLRIAVWLLAGEAALLGALSVLLLVSDLGGGASSQPGAVGVIGYVTVFAGIFGLLSWALGRRRAWARGPAIVLHMFMLPLGFALARGGSLLGGAALLAGVAGCVVLLAPATRIAVGRE